MISKKDVILVDCFDTIIHRHEHPYQILDRWAKCITRLYPNISDESLIKDRINLSKGMNIDIIKEGIYNIYQLMAEKYVEEGTILLNQKETFINDLIDFEILCECSSLYIDKKAIDFLRKISSKKKIYIVTDYHFNSNHINELLVYLGIESLFAGIFSSAEMHSAKYDGTLYNAVLAKLGVQCTNVVMIGDNRRSDYIMAKKHHIEAIHIPHILHQNIIRMMRYLDFDFWSHNVYKTYANIIRKNKSNYEEWILIIHYFCKKLYERNRNSEKIVFLAREGYFLKRCFDLYQKLCVPQNERIDTDYLKCSRRAIFSVQKEKCEPEFFSNISLKNYFKSIGFIDEEINSLDLDFDMNQVIDDFSNSKEIKYIYSNDELKEKIDERIKENSTAFNKYVKSKMGNRQSVSLVDVGWTGRMQQGITKLFPDINIKGFYVGIYDGLSDEPKNISREGLIFNKSCDGKQTPFFDILRSNIQLYEQLMMAPHGSACNYEFGDEENVLVREIWEESEKKLYDELIREVQETMLSMFKSICVTKLKYRGDDKELKTLAKMVLKSSLFQNKKRLLFMKKLNSGFVQNFQQESVGLQFDVKDVDLNISKIILKPETYVRYFAKIGVFLDAKNISFVRYPINMFFYIYVLLLNKMLL